MRRGRGRGIRGRRCRGLEGAPVYLLSVVISDSSMIEVLRGDISFFIDIYTREER